MAREAGASTEGPLFVPDAFAVRFAALVASAEREACAKVCDKHWDDNGQHCANAIRAMGDK
jgi:hypothetical protein